MYRLRMGRSLITLLFLIWLSAACEVIETRLPPTGHATLPTTHTAGYELDTLTSADGSLEEENDEIDASARTAAAPTGKLLVGYMNNETEVFRPSSYSVTFWSIPAGLPGATMTALEHAVTGLKASARINKTSMRSYVRKTLKAGWHIAHVPESSLWYQFQLRPGADGMLLINEHSNNPIYSGFFESYGKIRVSLWNGRVQPADAHLRCRATGPLSGQSVETWLYAEDGTGSKKSMYWFMPAGMYTTTFWANKPDGSGTYPETAGPLITIRPGRVYPHLKLAFN